MNRHRADRREGKITPELDVSSGSIRLEDIDQRIRQSTGLPAKQQRLSSSHASSLFPPSFPMLSKANTGDNQDHRSKRTKVRFLCSGTLIVEYLTISYSQVQKLYESCKELLSLI